jgi:mycothiol system anti-sigma-R factor
LSGTECQHVLEQIAPFLDGELREGECDRVREHMATCPSCRDRTEFQRHLKARVRGACGTCEVPPELLDRVRASLTDAAD